MSLNTRCPACDTVFKVVPDQLKVSSGWVRCGRCAEVFDAATHMLSAVAPVSTQLAVSARDIQPSPAPQAHARTTVPMIAATLVAKINRDEVPELSFVRHAKNMAFWQQTYVVRSLLAMLLGLIAVLAFQVVLDQRNQLAARHPSLQSALAGFCTLLGCVIEPVKQLDALKIESSSFQKIQESAQGDTFTLKVTLKNNATQPLAAPALELTLTDANDRPVMRRVLLASELGFQGKTLAAQSEWHGALSIFVASNLLQQREQALVTGYRVLVFYP